MSQMTLSESPFTSRVSTLVLCDRLLELAQDADRAGFTGTAERLLRLAHSVFDETPAWPH